MLSRAGTRHQDLERTFAELDFGRMREIAHQRLTHVDRRPAREMRPGG